MTETPRSPETPESPATPATPATAGTAGGRRRAAPATERRRRVDPVVLAAVVLPVVALGLGAAVRVGAPTPPATAPDTQVRTAATVVCPSAGVAAGTGGDLDAIVPDAGAVRAATGPAVGAATVELDGEEVPVADGAVATTSTGAPTTVRATGEAAPGLVAARYDAAGGAGRTCRTPDTGGWFVGLGAGADRASVLELTNPDAGTAVAAVTVLGETGPVDVEAARSVVVGAGETRRLDLGALAPTRGELGVRVEVTRGRLALGALQTTRPLDGTAGGSAWAPLLPAAAPATTLLGLPGDASTPRTLVVANPADAQVQVEVDLLGADGGYRPAGLEPVVVAPRAVASLDLTAAVADGLADGAGGALGIRVVSTGDVAATLRSGAGADEVAAVPAAPLTTGTALLPPQAGTARLVLSRDAEDGTGDGSGDGSGDDAGDGAGDDAGEEAAPATVVARAADGAELLREDVALDPGASAAVDLPAGAARVDVESAGDAVRGALVVTAGARTSVLALAPAVPEDLVAVVRRAWP
ncbi:hypothetical protein INN71_05435 [Nocardioides sp. ChNu-153]|uniref:DUF5719 family protein n=1 Tax=Nocardioides sp. ChNu-153 TaxID=2779364 RepID=UPI00264D3908|nr:DUF5719 family protein [Nocardioides sp. ChNu-153]MDN7120827.1 hypothetical protein [Nocardioides sp. ChNu-153]